MQLLLQLLESQFGTSHLPFGRIRRLLRLYDLRLGHTIFLFIFRVRNRSLDDLPPLLAIFRVRTRSLDDLLPLLASRITHWVTCRLRGGRFLLYDLRLGHTLFGVCHLPFGRIRRPLGRCTTCAWGGVAGAKSFLLPGSLRVERPNTRSRLKMTCGAMAVLT